MEKRLQGRPANGLFVSFEGGEGAGKSTQIANVRTRLQAAGYDAVETREPGGSERAERIRSILLSGQAKSLGRDGEALLFAAARQDHVNALIGPALRAGSIVLCDRFVDSTRVYQGAVAGVGQPFLAALEFASTSGTMPDVTILIDVPVEIGLERARRRRLARGEPVDRFEAEGAPFHDQVRAAFLAIAAADPSRCAIVDGARAAEEVASAVWSVIAPHLALRAGQGSRGGAK